MSDIVPLTFYIVFHKEIITPYNEPFLQWIAVNEQIEKIIPSSVPPESILKEWEFPDFNPFYQICNIHENSVIHHFFHNPSLLDSSKYVGIGQYDMKLNVELFRHLTKALTQTDKVCAFLPFNYNFILLFDKFLQEFWIKYVIEPYNKKYQKNHTIQSLSRHGFIPLINCFIVPVGIWKDLVEFSRFITPHLIKGMNWDITHLGGTLERVHGLYLLFAIEEKRFDYVSTFPAIEHH